MTMNPYQELLQIAKSAALNAGSSIMDIYDSGDFDSFSKADDSPVTTADYKANEIITEHLKLHSPDIPIMSEESKHESLEIRKNWSRYWLIDPIDGTQEFIARSGDFAINIALIENNEPAIGVIYWPVGETLYFASKGHGAFKESPKEDKQIFVRQLADPESGEVLVAISRRQPKDRVMSRMTKERIYSTIPLGSCSLKSCFIAEGKADVFLRIGITGEWDTGAPQCIVSEAGGKILSAEFEPLTYNRRKSLLNPDFVVLGDQRVDWEQIVLYNLVSKDE
ncbi:3'(2'),5'-bisphosphate nucleotidase CysQ [Planctobacterium marinum]|uniref:3'(2'),5'-bisphosphate nucleotidase CysQ n=2 Tax=Planctobacterium marinum TaxID=1631968 RepID=A0AA48HH68_9ALTE|nr:3'(2'),5'-bisphosphate nucleotidase CysQ [Planctobacterium marinum]